MQKSILLAAIQKEIQRHDFSYFVDEPPAVAQGGKGVVVPGCALAFTLDQREHLPMDAIFQPGQLVRVNLAGLDAGGVTFQAAVTDAVGHILKQTSEQPPKYLVELLFSFRGVSQVEVPADRIHAQVTTGKMGGT